VGLALPEKSSRSRLGDRLRAAAALARRAVSREQNPFLTAELRSNSRRLALFRALLFHALTLCLLLFAFLLLVRWRWRTDLRFMQQALAPHLVTAVACFHVWMVVHASDSRVRQAAQREETAKMWEMLLITPLSPTEIVLFKSVFPVLYAGLIALLGLPVYLLAAAVSGRPVRSNADGSNVGASR